MERAVTAVVDLDLPAGDVTVAAGVLRLVYSVLVAVNSLQNLDTGLDFHHVGGRGIDRADHAVEYVQTLCHRVVGGVFVDWPRMIVGYGPCFTDS